MTVPPPIRLTAAVILANASVSFVTPSPAAPNSSGVKFFKGVSPPPFFPGFGALLVVTDGRSCGVGESLHPERTPSVANAARHSRRLMADLVSGRSNNRGFEDGLANTRRCKLRSI